MSAALLGLEFCITGNLSVVRRDFESLLREHGALVHPRVTKNVTHLICSDPTTAKAKKAQDMGIEIVDEDTILNLIFGCNSSAAVTKIRQSTSSTIQNESGTQTEDRKSVPTSISSTSSTSVVDLTNDYNETQEEETDELVVDGLVVDSYARVGPSFVVLPYSAKLVLVDTCTCADMFFVMQCLQKLNDGSYCVYMRWGETGEIGCDSTQHFPTLTAAQSFFVQKFFNKTGLVWSDRLDATPVPGRHRFVRQTQNLIKGTIWEYWVDDGVDGKTTKWYPYDDNANTTVEQLYAEHGDNTDLSRRFLKLGNSFIYQLDFISMTQTNMRHENLTSRRIRRRMTPGSPSEKRKEQKNEGTNWNGENSIQAQKLHVQDKKRPSDLQNSYPLPAKKVKTIPPQSKESVLPISSNDLADGEEIQVPGSDYRIKNVGGVYSCTCPAWRYQSKKIDIRTCKHIKNLRGEASEQARLRANGGGGDWIVANTSGKKKISAVADSTPTNESKNQNDSLFDASGLTLAHKWDPSKHKAHSNFLMSEKLDGMRALWNGAELVSRAGNSIDAPDFFLKGFPSEMALDGELFMARGKFQETVSITRRKNGGEEWRKIRFVVFDAPTVDGGFETRLKAAGDAVAPLEFAEILEHTACLGETHLRDELDRIEKLGGEGLMMREKGSAYVKGRSQKLLKVKTFHDDEGIVTGHQPGTGKHKGRMGALLCRLRNGIEFKCGTGFSDQERENPPPIGSVITVTYFELTNAGIPRFPVFQRIRTDVDTAGFN